MSTWETQQPEIYNVLDNLRDCFFDRKPLLDITTIAVECAAAWGVPVAQLKGKIVHNDPADKLMKYSFLAGVHFFSDCQVQELESLFGYGRALHNAINFLMYDMRTGRKYSQPLQSFFSTLSAMCPDTFERWKKKTPRQTYKVEYPIPMIVICTDNDRIILPNGYWWDPAPELQVGNGYISLGTYVNEDGDLLYAIKDSDKWHCAARFVERRVL